MAKKGNVFVRAGKGIAAFFRCLGTRFTDGSVGTKISHLIMGVGNLCNGQIVKGILFFLCQLAFLAFMILCPEVNGTPLGGKALANLITLGTNPGGFDEIKLKVIIGDNSMLMLLFGLVTIGVIALFLVVWNAAVQSSYEADLAKRGGRKPRTFREDLARMGDEDFHKTMLAPTIVGVLLFTVLPTIYMILIAFTDYANANGQVFFDWVGLENFVSLFTQPDSEIGARFLPVAGWTLCWAFFATGTCYFGGILLALLINRKGIKGKKIFRTVFILTIAIPQFISLLAIRNLLSFSGPVNTFLVESGISKVPVDFFGLDYMLAPSGKVWSNDIFIKFSIIMVNMWIGIPYTMLMTSGILMNIPQDMYEAARIDGAGPIKMFAKITFPYIFFIMTPYLISSFIGNITSFNIIFMLTGGGPAVAGFKAGKTDLLVTWLYKLTIDNSLYNVGAVIGILTFLCTATITLITYRRSKSYKEEDTFQ